MVRTACRTTNIRTPALTQALQHRLDNKTKPLGSLGRLEALALQLGEIGYLNREIDWLNVLLKAQNLSRNEVYDYLEYYSAAVSRQLGSQAALISEWLQERIRIGKM